nr:TetR/AcrR family transcriptional regulator C-terminal domain-containing protein [uncultured Acetobacterium sp.]
MAIDIHNLLAEALLELCEAKPLNTITIKDLLKKTGISRQTFYNRFRDKNDLIQWTYEHKVLNIFLSNDPESTYYKNTLSYYKNIEAHRNFLKQACAIRDQNCLIDFIVQFAIDYDLKWHQLHYGEKPLSPEFVFASRYHSVASINAAIEWISSDNPEPAEVMASRITNLRKISLSNTLFGVNNEIYSCN